MPHSGTFVCINNRKTNPYLHVYLHVGETQIFIERNKGLAVKITKRRLTKLIREAGLADIRDSTLDWYTDHNGEQRMVPGVSTTRRSPPRSRPPKVSDYNLSQYVAEYIAYGPHGYNSEKYAIEQVAEDEGVSVQRVQAAVEEWGTDYHE